MYLIYAEKPDVGTKIAAALDCIRLENGTVITFEKLEKYITQKSFIAERARKGHFKIKYKGEEVIVTWGFGHLCELKQASDYNKEYRLWSKLPVPFFPEKWELKPIESTKSQLMKVKELCKGAEYIISATDDDREGELLFAYMYEYLKLKIPYKYRVKIASQTKQGFIDAFNNLIDAKNCKNIENAGRARGIADAAIGWNCTAQLTLKKGGKGEVLSVGRCQTAVENMIVQRELEIRNFKPEDYFTIDAVFSKNNIDFKAEYKDGKFATKEDAEKVLAKIKGHKGIVIATDKKIKTEPTPLLYNQDLIQMDANAKYGLKMKETLEITQSLYDKGYTTYPRTDSTFLNEDMTSVINDILDMLENISEYSALVGNIRNRTLNKKYFNNAKVTSHYAIIPTTMQPVNLTPNERKIYDLIAKSVIRMIYKDALIEKVNVLINVNGEMFKATGSTIKDRGWYDVSGSPKENILPDLQEKDTLIGLYELSARKTQPPKRYTDATLSKAMLNAGKDIEDEDLRKFMTDHKIEGIGRPSSKAGIVETIMERGYAERKKNAIYATDKGIELINLIPFDEIKSAELTAKWESRMSDIENGNETLENFIKDIKILTTDWCNKIININGGKQIMNAQNNSHTGSNSNGMGVNCPECGKEIIKHDWGYGCSGYKEGCKFSIGKILCERKFKDSEIKKLIKAGKIGPLSGFKGKYGEFSKSLKIGTKSNGNLGVVFDDDEKKTAAAETEYSCPLCGEKLREFDWGYGCSGYKNGCRFALSKKPYNKELTNEEIEEILNDGETSHEVMDLKTAEGKSFNGILFINEDGKVKVRKREV